MTSHVNRRGVLLLALLALASAGAIVSVAALAAGPSVRTEAEAAADSAAAWCRRHDDSVRTLGEGGAICG